MVTPSSTLPDAATDDAATTRLWLERIPAHYGDESRARIADAAELMQHCVGDEQLETGESAARHRLATAEILVGLRMDAQTLCAALLGGCVGHAGIDAASLDARFGSGLARMVQDLGRISQLADLEPERAGAGRDKPREHQRREEKLRRMLLDIAEDVRAILIVLAEQLHLMRAAKHLPPERRRELADDTRRLYAPLANRLGVWQLKWELEDLSLRYLEPDEYQRIARLLRERRDERQAYIARVIATLQQEFERVGLRANISGRPKHIYSIWRKMQRKRVDIDEIFDLRAVRVMVDSEDDCYTALSVVHGLWPYIPDEFDDYISKPKGNFYRSLHTAVTGPDGKVLEIQIRTPDMHRHAEYGVAAHWAYKESAGHDAAFQRRVVLMRNWLEQTLDAPAGAGQDDPIGEGPPAQSTEASSIYVLTPQAKVIELPAGATPLDFAYAIHSEVGHHCRGARVDGRIVPLTYKLKSGETVEIITQKNAAPSRDWLSAHHGYLITSRARNRVRQWFKHQDYERHLAEGRNLLEKELARLGIDSKPSLEPLAARFNLQHGDDLLAALGRGDLAVGAVARQLGEPHGERRDGPPDNEQSLALTPPRRQRRHSERPEVIVAGVPDLMTQIASCCHPVPYDAIVGFITRGRGVAVHRSSCNNISRLRDDERERLIEVEWADQPDSAAYPVDIIITAADRKGLLRDVSSVLADEDANVIDTETHTDATNDRASMRFTVEVSDIGQLDQVCGKLRQLTDVIEVRRSGH
jgi:GTP pyrophosphokinase